MTFFADFVTNTPLTFARMRQMLEDQGGGLQEGVLAAGDLKVAQRVAGGANMSVDVAVGAGWIEVDSGTRQGLAHIYNDAVANGVVTNSHATLPRIDRIVIQYNDTSIPAGVGGDVPTLRVIAGVATTGATLDNETGIAALPNDAMQISTVLVPAASTSVTNANIRDRRKYARGFFYSARGTNGSQVITTTLAAITGLAAIRAELSGVPLICTWSTQGIAGNFDAAMGIISGITYDGASAGSGTQNFGTNTTGSNWRLVTGHILITPTPGSHLLASYAQHFVNGGASTQHTVDGTASLLTLKEEIRQNANNN